MDFNQPFICCGVCHETGKSQSLYLTSCAHVLCKEHASNHAQNPSNLEGTKTRCMVCNHDYVSVLKLDQRLPNDIRSFFVPFPTQVEQLFAVTQFQFCGMAERILHQDQTIEQMDLKIKKQKSLLLLAKESVSKVEMLERKIQDLEQENKTLRSSSSLSSFGKRPQLQSARPSTIDLTGNDSFEENQPLQDHRKVVSHSFLNQVKQSSQQKIVPSKTYVSPVRPTDATLDFVKGRIAESTNILNNSPMQQIPNLRTSIGSPSNNSSAGKVFSNGSSNGSSSSRDYIVPGSGMVTNQSKFSNRTNGNRAATSQIAQRISSHMKVGNSLHRSQSSSLGSKRPGSSFSAHNHIFKRR